MKSVKSKPRSKPTHPDHSENSSRYGRSFEGIDLQNHCHLMVISRSPTTRMSWSNAMAALIDMDSVQMNCNLAPD